MKELAGAESHFFTRLNNDVTVTGIVGARIYIGEAPRERAYPLIVISAPNFTDANYFGLQSRALTDLQIQVAIFSKSKTISPIVALGVKVDDLFDKDFIPAQNADAFIESSRRVGGYHLAEEDADGAPVQRVVQIYGVRSRRV